MAEKTTHSKELTSIPTLTAGQIPHSFARCFQGDGPKADTCASTAIVKYMILFRIDVAAEAAGLPGLGSGIPGLGSVVPSPGRSWPDLKRAIGAAGMPTS